MAYRIFEWYVLQRQLLLAFIQNLFRCTALVCLLSLWGEIINTGPSFHTHSSVPGVHKKNILAAASKAPFSALMWGGWGGEGRGRKGRIYMKLYRSILPARSRSWKILIVYEDSRQKICLHIRQYFAIFCASMRSGGGGVRISFEKYSIIIHFQIFETYKQL